MSRIIVAVTGLVMPIRKDSQVAFGLRSHQLGFRASIVQSLSAGVYFEVKIFLFGAAHAFGARVALTAAVMD